MQNLIETEIHSVLDFFKWVKETFYIDYEVSGEIWRWPQDKVYYRGHSNRDWELVPSVFRKEENLPTWLDECKILNKASQVLWSELSSMRYLEKLIYLQHYGLRTRLLDVTFNPLIALYFACVGCKKESGVVYCGHNYESGDEDDYVRNEVPEITAKYLFTHKRLDGLLSWCKDNNINIDNFTIPMFIHPPLNNPRIEAQSGAFVMAPLAKKEDDKYKINEDSLVSFFENRVAIIPADYKENILRELSILGINSGSVFQSVTEKLQTIMQEDWWSTTKEIVFDDYIH